MTTPALEVRNLTVTVALRGGRRAVVLDDVSFSVRPQGTLGLVGESGSGKTMTSLAIVRLLPPSARVESGDILLGGESLLAKSEKQMRRLRGSHVSMVLQDPMTALDPSFTIRSQLAEPLELHLKLRGDELESAMVNALEQVHLSGAKDRMSQYPHQLSGGMRQRVTSAIALAAEPDVLIADEPTTALDVTTQARYLQLLRELQRTTGFALILIAHDLMLVRHMCQDVVVMYAGQVVEQGSSVDVFESPQHPYTRALLASDPGIGEDRQLESIEGSAPDVGEHLDGCRFAARCAFARQVCHESVPSLTDRPGVDRSARCWGTEPGGWIDS